MEKENPNYYSILPANVRYDKKLTPFEKILYSEIVALTNKDGYCWASNNYFSELYHKGEKWISKSLNNLAKKGYLTIEVEKNFMRKIYIIGGKQVDTPTPKVKKEKQVLPEIYYQLAQLLFDKIKENHSNLSVQYNKEKWADIFRKIIEIDKYKVEVVRQVVLFSQWDKFWKKNILSASKFRQKFNTLLAQMPDNFTATTGIHCDKLYYQDKEVFVEVKKELKNDTVFLTTNYYYVEGGKKVLVDKKLVFKK